MNYRLLIASLTAYCSMSALFSYAKTGNLKGAWKGPKDLKINVCDDGQNQQYVCSCGIFRTWGWADLSATFSNDSIIIDGNPLEGRFRIESKDRLEGNLTMGNPGDEWYYNDRCELIRQKPLMPDNLNHTLEGTILPTDYGKFSLDREKAQEVLSTVTPGSIGYAEKRAVERLLNAKTYPILLNDMTVFKRVRSIQIDARKLCCRHRLQNRY